MLILFYYFLYNLGGFMFKCNQNNIGEFVNENYKFYSYRKTNDQWALSNNFTHEIDVLDGIRFGVVKKQ